MVESESKDNVGNAGDHDVAYAPGNPRSFLTLRQQSRCLIMRGYVRDVGHAPLSIRADLRFGGDSDWAVPTNSGLWIPDPRWTDTP